MIEYCTVGMRYGDHQILTDINLKIHAHELFVLVGPSGSGKTTLIRMVNRLTVPTSGQVKVAGQDVAASDLAKLRLSMGYVLQTASLFPNLTIADNVTIQLEQQGCSKAERKRKAQQLLAAVGLKEKDYLTRYPAALSGGQQQRVAIARALATNPQLILMDESFSALDPVLRRQMQDLLLSLHAKHGMTVLFVTHDMQEALRLGDRIGVINAGRLQQVGTPQEIIEHPANAFVRNFFASARPRYGTLTDLLAATQPQPAVAGPLVTTVAEILRLPVCDGELCFSIAQQAYRLPVAKLLHYLGKREEK